MRIGEKHGQTPAKFPFAGHKYPFVGNKYIIKYHYGIGNTGQADGRCIFVIFLTVPHRTGYQFHAFPVAGNRKSHCIIFVVFHKCTGGNYENLIRIRCLGYRHFKTTHHNAIFPFFHNMDIGIRIGLFRRPFHPIAFAVGLCTTSYQVILLIDFHIINKTLVVIGAFCLINFVSADGQSTNGIMSHTSLDTTTGTPCTHTNQLLLFHKVVRILRNVSPSVYNIVG